MNRASVEQFCHALACYGHSTGAPSLARSKQANTVIAVELPSTRFLAPPALEQASRLAVRVRESMGMGASDPVDIEAMVLELGWQVQKRHLDADWGGVQALMAPAASGFLFVVDPRPSPSCPSRSLNVDAEVLERALFCRRLAHELGHVFFYDTGRPARRLLRHSEAEEKYCDAFAAALLLPSQEPDSWVAPSAAEWISHWGTHPALF